MPDIKQIIVLDQMGHGFDKGNQACGIHTFKNAILSLLLASKAIDQSNFDKLSKSPDLFNTIYLAIKGIITNQSGDIDLSVPNFLDLIERFKRGEINLDAHGITKKMIDHLKLTVDGAQDITVVDSNHATQYGLGGEEYDLDTAAMIANLARRKGEYTHSFAVTQFYASFGHWMTAVLHQETTGKKSWEFMDSYKNQTHTKGPIVSKIEEVLNKSEPELQAYLIEAYDKSNVNFNLWFTEFFYFDDLTYALIEDATISVVVTGIQTTSKNIKQYCLDDNKNRNEIISNIIHRMTFMETADWLKASLGKEEIKRVKALYAITKFMLDEGAIAHIEIKEKLEPVLTRLAGIIELNNPTVTAHEGLQAPVSPELVTTEVIGTTAMTSHKLAVENAGDKTFAASHSPSDAKITKGAASQTVVAMISAVETGEPSPAPHLLNRLVNSIANIIRGLAEVVTNFIGSIGTLIGIK